MTAEAIPMEFDSEKVNTIIEETPYQELIALEGDSAVGPGVWNLVEKIIEHKVDNGLHDRWTRNYELGRNKHWKFKSDKIPLISGNLLYTHRQRTVNHLTDNSPTFNIRALGQIQEDFQKQIEVWDHAVKFWWHETEQQSILADSIWNGETYGTAIEWVRFNGELEAGIGEVEAVIVDPFYFGVYPVRERENQKGMANLFFMPVHLNEAKRLWPDHADKIRTDAQILNDIGEERQELTSGSAPTASRSISFGGEVSRLIGFAADGVSPLDEMCLVVFAFVKDFTEISARIEGEESEPLSDSKYTGNIRHIVICNQGGLVLEDKDNPNVNPNLPEEAQKMTYLYDKFPFTRVSSLQETTAPWGPCDFEQLEGLQMEINKSMSQFNAARDKAADAKPINPRTSGVPNHKIRNYGGILNPTSPNHGISYLQGQPINKDSMLAVDLYKQFFFLVSGSFELDQADQAGKQVIAYKAIAALLERQQTMLRGKDRSYMRLVRERGRMYLSHAMNFYTTQRWITYEDSGEEQAISLKGIDMVLPIRLMVVSGSTMPISKVQQREEALALAGMNRIDNQALLEALDYPDRRNIMKRMEMGPVGKFLERLQAVLPPQILQTLAQIAQMEEKDFERAVKEKKIAPIQLPDQQPDPEQLKSIMELKKIQAELVEIQADAQKTIAEAEKVAAEKALKVEQITTERVKQRQAMEGINLDKEQLKIERMKVLHEIEQQEKETEGKVKERATKVLDVGLKYASQSKDKGPYREKGMSSNNREVLE